MPMMDELLEKLQASPPQNADQLESLLDETGYELLSKEPGTDVPGEEEEAPEDMGPEDEPKEDVDEDDKAGEDDAEGGMDMLREMAGAPVKMGNDDMSPRMKLRVTTIKAAKNAVDKDKKKSKY